MLRFSIRTLILLTAIAAAYLAMWQTAAADGPTFATALPAVIYLGLVVYLLVGMATKRQ
jgi:hypothetical protein